MATIHKEFPIEKSAATVWTAVRDVGAVQRLFPGVLIDSKLEGDERVVTFANGVSVNELIVTLDDAKKRLVYASIGGRARHHSSSIEIVPSRDASCRVVWITDVFPEEAAAPIAALVERGAAAMKRVLEAQTP